MVSPGKEAEPLEVISVAVLRSASVDVTSTVIAVSVEVSLVKVAEKESVALPDSVSVEVSRVTEVLRVPAATSERALLTVALVSVVEVVIFGLQGDALMPEKEIKANSTALITGLERAMAPEILYGESLKKVWSVE